MTQMKVGSVGSLQSVGESNVRRVYAGHTLDTGPTQPQRNALPKNVISGLSTGVSQGNYSPAFEDDLGRVEKRIRQSRVLFDAIERFRQLRDGWDGVDAAAPIDTAFSNAIRLIDYFRTPNFFPYKVAASVEGGIGFTFRGASGKGYIECTNDGQLFAACYGANIETQTWEFSLLSASAKETLERIKQQIGA